MSNYCLFWGALAKLRKSTTSFVMSASLYVRPHGKTRFQLDGFSWNLTFDIYSKSVEKIHFFYSNSHKNNWHAYFTWMSFYINISLNSFWFEKHFRQICRKVQNTHSMFDILFSEKILAVYGIMWKKYWRAGHAIFDNIIWRIILHSE